MVFLPRPAGPAYRNSTNTHHCTDDYDFVMRVNKSPMGVQVGHTYFVSDIKRITEVIVSRVGDAFSFSQRYRLFNPHWHTGTHTDTDTQCNTCCSVKVRTIIHSFCFDPGSFPPTGQYCSGTFDLGSEWNQRI